MSYVAALNVIPAGMTESHDATRVEQPINIWIFWGYPSVLIIRKIILNTRKTY